MYVFLVPSPSKWAAPGLWVTSKPKLPSYDATTTTCHGSCSTWAASAWFYCANRFPRGVSSSQRFPAPTGNGGMICEISLFNNITFHIASGVVNGNGPVISGGWQTWSTVALKLLVIRFILTNQAVIRSVLSKFLNVGIFMFFSSVPRSPKRRRSRSNSRTRLSKHRRSRSRSRERHHFSPHSRSQERRERDKERERRQKGLPPLKNETLSSESEFHCWNDKLC